MKFISAKTIPFWIATGVIGLVCLAHSLPRIWPSMDMFQRLEWMTYDWRVRHAIDYPTHVATNLGAVLIDDESLRVVNVSDGYGFLYPWPRHVYGRAVAELVAQKAALIGFDIFFIEAYPNYTETRTKFSNGTELSADQYFARQLRLAKNVVLGAPWDNEQLLAPTDILRTNAMAVGHASTDRDSDGVLRRAIPYFDDPKLGRIWQMGIVLAAKSMGLDLAKAEVSKDRIVLRGNGVERTIPLDEKGYFYINWELTANDPRIIRRPFHQILIDREMRAMGTNIPALWKNKIVIVGSTGTGNNISDVGATSLEKNTFLVSKHWNVVNSIITGNFVTASSNGTNLLLIIGMGAISAFITWRMRAPWPTLLLFGVGTLYTLIALRLYIHQRYWIPIVLPIGGSLLMNHVFLVTYQVLFEQTEKRRVKDVFNKLVSPNVVHELLKAKKLNLGGSRAEITVFFADVRGFTQLTDQNQDRAEQFVKDHNLTGAEREAYFDESARETLATVNIYLSTIADQIKSHDGTLDKYIGDCVMAFWGAPTPNTRHAACCVQAAIDAQRAMHAVNMARAAENKRREEENIRRAAEGKYPLPMQALLALGTGINTGVAIVGLMGSAQHIVSYTVFGREINLASRLEGVSGRGRIIIGENTYNNLLRDDPALAATAVELAPVTPKGFTRPVRNFEIPWKQDQPAATATPTAPGGAAPH